MGSEIKLKTLLLIGYGGIARRHLANIKALIQDANVLVLRQSKSVLEPEDDWASVTLSVAEALAFAPDAAIIASPASCHVEQALALAKINTHLLIEKPLSVSMDGVDALFEECSARGLTLMVGYNIAFSKALLAIKEQLDAGAIGDIVSIQAEVGQYLPNWRPGKDYRATVSARGELGGGVLFELSHELDYVNWLLGGTASVSCFSARTGVLDMDVEDSATLILEGASRGIASIHLNMVQKNPSRTCRIVGTKGLIFWNYLENRVDVLRDGEAPTHVALPLRESNTVYLEQLAHFFDCVCEHKTPLTEGIRAKRVLQIILAAKESAKEGRRVLV